MGMRLQLGQTLRPELQQRFLLSPQIIQSIEILQKSIQELEAHVAQEMIDNPTIEIATDSPEATPTDGNGESRAPDRLPDADGERDHAVPAEVDYERIRNLAGEWSDWSAYGPPRRRGADDGEDRKAEALQNTAARAETLQDHLFHQYCLMVDDPQFRELAELVVYNIDDKGYLRATTEELLRDAPAGTTPEDLEIVIREVQTLEPPGVGARDLKECLLLQLDGRAPERVLSRRIIEDHLDDLRKNKLPRIAHDLGVSIERVKSLVATLGDLSPQPGLAFSSERPDYVAPDVVIDQVDDEYQVRLVTDRIPRISIAPDYEAMLRSRSVSDEEKKFIRAKIESATQLRDAIEQREHTLLRVVRKVFDHQRAFLDGGVEHLRPLKMQDIAEELGIHVSTVSRALANKHVQTPQGLFPLKYFFTGGVSGAVGAAPESTEAVRAKIREIVEKENRQTPLSDDQIADELKRIFQLDVARRTVTKYRKAMRIASSRQRRVY